MKLNRSQIKALNFIKAGEYIVSPVLATTLLELQRKCPGLIKIEKSPNVNGMQPFFHAIPTAAGLAEIQEAK